MPARSRPTFESVARIVDDCGRVDVEMYGWFLASSSGDVGGCTELERLVKPHLAANTPRNNATFVLSVPAAGGRTTTSGYIRSAWVICLKSINSGHATIRTAANAMNMLDRSSVRIEDFFKRLVGIEEELSEDGMPRIAVSTPTYSSGSSAQIPRDAILAVAENGLTESEAEEAIEAALARGELKRSSLVNPDSNLYRQCDERRFMMNRILNALALKRAEARSSESRDEPGQGDPLVDILTGRPAGSL